MIQIHCRKNVHKQTLDTIPYQCNTCIVFTKICERDASSKMYSRQS